MHFITNQLQKRCVYLLNIEMLNAGKCTAATYRHYIVIFIVFVAILYLTSKRVRRIGSIPVALYYDFLLKSDSEILLCYVCDRKGERERKRDTTATCTCVESSCYNLSVEFFDPASFHSPGDHFLLSSRISSRDRNMMMHS